MLRWVGYLLSRCNLPMAFIWKNWRDGMLLIPNCFQYPSICNKKGLIFDFAKSCDNSNLIKNTPGVKRSGQELKQALLKKMWNQMGGQCLLVLIGLKVLVMINSMQDSVLWPGHLNFDHINIRRPEPLK